MRSTIKRGKSSVSKHSIFIAGRKTSVGLEDEFWDGLKEGAVARNIRLDTLVTKIDSKRQQANLSSAIRLFVLDLYQRRGHQLRRPTFSLVERSAEAGPSLMRKCPMRAFLRYSALAGMNTKSADGFTAEVQQRQRQRSEKRRPRYGRASSTPYLKNLRSRSCIIGSVVKTTVFPPAMRWPRIRGKFSSLDGVLQPPS